MLTRNLGVTKITNGRNSPIAQLVEQVDVNHCVEGSSPSGRAREIQINLVCSSPLLSRAALLPGGDFACAR